MSRSLDVHHRLQRRQAGHAVVGERDIAAGQGVQDGRGVRFGQPQEADPGPVHGHDPVTEGEELGTDLPGAVVEMGGKLIAQNAATADAAVVVRALVSAAGAGEVADAAGAVCAAGRAVVGQAG